MRDYRFYLLAVSGILFSGCQEEDFGYTYQEVHRSVVEREYAAAFCAEFPDVDPDHTWMCTPDTFYYSHAGLTRTLSGLPEIEMSTETLSVPYDNVTAVLQYMPEQGRENEGKCAQNFEYIALRETTYEISPMFWGRKFADTNKVGIFYIDANGDKQDMEPFWDDTKSCEGRIMAVYKDGVRDGVPQSTKPITDDPDEGYSNQIPYIPLTHECATCGGTGTLRWQNEVRNPTMQEGQTMDDFTVRDINGFDYKPSPVLGGGPNGMNCIEVHSVTNPTEEWSTQFFVSTEKSWAANTTFHLRMWIKASQEIKADAQLHDNPGGYKCNFSTLNLSFTTEWKEISIVGTIPQDGNGAHTIAFNLNKNKNTADKDKEITYYFADVRWERQTGNIDCPDCVDGKSPVDHYEMPKYKLTVPEGTKWGLYLETLQRQGETETIRWYSNAKHNTKEEVCAAATFSFGGVTYCCFEDAPHNTHNGDGTGACTQCEYGHWDKDFNDIVLTITPRPIESTYRAIKYRVMCEDLGGTFDWDFNDVVYDVIYEDGKGADNHATVTIVLQAVGGTLPIYIVYDEPEHPDRNSKSSELHELLSGQQKDEATGLYTPVNVSCDYYSTIMATPSSKTIKTITLEQDKYDNLDVRTFVKHIVVQAEQDGVPTSTVVFPDSGGNAVPQCFMTSVGTEWAKELQNISDRYEEFPTWVANQQKGKDWWNTDPNF